MHWRLEWCRKEAAQDAMLVREIPRYLRVEHVLSIFGSKYGAVTNIELPTETIPIKEIT